jgi:PAS domain S-box-containing protein
MLQRAEADWEKQLQEIEHKYQTLLSHLHDVVLIADDAGAIAFVSPNVQRWLGYTPAEIQALGQIQTFLGTIESDRFECDLEDKFGNRHRFEVEVKAVAIEGGTQLYCCRPLEAQVRYRDRYEALIQAQTAELARLNEQLQQALNDRRHVEESARFSQKFFNTIFENLPNIIFVKAAGDLRFISINRAGERLLGCQRDLILGKTDSELFPADLAKWFRNQDRQVIATQQPVECLEAVVLPQNSQNAGYTCENCRFLMISAIWFTFWLLLKMSPSASNRHKHCKTAKPRRGLCLMRFPT